MTSTIDYTALVDEALIDLLLTQEDRVPRAAADEIVRRGVPLAARLVAILDDDALWRDPGPRWWAVVHAYYLLARMQPPGSLEVLLLALDRAERQQIDWITGSSPSVLAAFGPRALPRLKEVIGDAGKDAWTRIWALRAVGRIGRAHAECRDECLLLLRALGRDETKSELHTTAGDELLSFALPEDRKLVESLAGDFVYNEHDVAEIYDGKTRHPESKNVDWMDFYAADAVAGRQARWREEERERMERAALPAEHAARPWTAATDESLEIPPPWASNEPPPPPLRAGPKVGRNEPCPCASGKKFKKRCGG